MRNKHRFEEKIMCQCPKCGTDFDKRIGVLYTTNQRGDVIEHKIIQFKEK